MKKNLLINSSRFCLTFLSLSFFILFFNTKSAKAQLTGTKSVCSSGCDYATVEAAVTDLNTYGVGTGGVVIQVSAGHTETLTSAIELKITGTSANPIRFENNGGSPNPKITAYTGTGSLDGIFILSGSDYVTIDGIDLSENSSNTSTTTRMEWGYALLKKNATSSSDGCCYNVIKNCTITLNKAHTGSSGIGPSGCKGIYVANHIRTTTSQYSPTDTITNTNNYNQFLSNTISDVINGIVLYGYSSSNSTYDVGNRIGDIGQGNTITNFGGGSSVTYPMYIYAQNRSFIDGNTISGGNLTTSSIYGIYTTAGTNSTIRIRKNKLTLTPVLSSPSSTTTSIHYGIFNTIGISGTNNLVEITDNEISNCTFSNSSSATIYYFYNSAAGFTTKIERNKILNNTIGSTSISCTGTHYHFYNSASNTNIGSTLNVSDNTIKNNSRLSSGTTTGGTTYAFFTSGGNSLTTINNDTIQSNVYKGTSTTYDMYISTSSSPLFKVYNNYINGNSRSGGTSGTHYLSFFGGSTTSINNFYNNSLGNYTSPASFTGTIYGIYFNGSIDQNYIYRNKVHDIDALSGYVYGIYNTYGTTQIFNNTVGNLKASTSSYSPAIRGIDVSSGTAANVSYNTVYIPSFTSSGSGFSSAALYTSTSLNTTIKNNIFINLATPGSSGRSVAHWRNGLSPDKILNYSQNNIYYAGSPSSTRLIYWDGILACQTMDAYRRRVKIAEMGSVSENVTFASTTGSNSNFLHIDATAQTNVESNGMNIFGITDDYDATARQGNTGYSGSGTAPDIGADEGSFTTTSSDVFPPAMFDIFSPISCSSTTRPVKARIIDQGGLPESGSNLPRLYYKKGKAGSFQSVKGSLASGTRFNGVWNFTVDYSTMSGFTIGDTCYAFCIVQDSAANISSFPAGVTASSVNSVSVTPRDTFWFRNGGAGMGGTYTVGGTGADYSTINAAVADLTSKGLCGPVVIDIDSGTYREKINVGAIAGSSKENYIIFQSATGKAEDVIIIDSALSNIDAHVWRFNTSMYMTLRKVTLLQKGPSYGWGLHIMGNGTQNIKIKNCVIISNDSTSGNSNKIPLVINGSNSTYSSGAKIDSLEIDSNIIKYGYFGLVAYGSSTTSRQDNNFYRNNIFYGAYYYGTYMFYQSGLRFNNNRLLRKNYSNLTYGVYMYYFGQYLTSAPSEISGNFIDAGTSYAMYLYYGDNLLSKGTISNNTINTQTGGYGIYTINSNNWNFYNNMIWGQGSYGLYMSTCNYWDIYHNTINMYNASSNYTSYNIYNNTTTNVIKNNLLTNTNTWGNTGGYLVYQTVASTPGTIDNNIYWHPTGATPIYNGSAFPISQSLLSTTGGANSKFFKPTYYSFSDLRVYFDCNLTGSYISSVPFDIYNTTRSTSKPIIGAHESQALSRDVAVYSIVKPAKPLIAGMQQVRVNILNNGSTPIDTVTVSYSINNNTPVSQTFYLSNPLALCDTTSVLFSTGYNHISGCVSFKAWTSNPDNLLDENTLNDTTAFNIGVAFSGTYTIGGSSPDFATINQAINDLVCGGVIGPVTFNIRPGRYMEKVTLPYIAGTSNTNWITFQSSTGNKEDVIIVDSTLSTSFTGLHYVWRFDNTKYVTLRNVSLHVKGIYGWAAHIFGNNCKKIKIKGCNLFILGDSLSTSTFNVPLVVSASLTTVSSNITTDSLEIDSNHFRYGYANVYFYSSTAIGSRSDYIFMRNNYFYGGRAVGVNLYYLSGLVFSNNVINGKFATSYPVYLYYLAQKTPTSYNEFSGNKILYSSASYSMYFYYCTNSASLRGLFANNMVVFENTTYGIYAPGTDFWDFYYNSFNQYSGAATYALYTSMANNVYKNNIFAMNSPTANAYGYTLYSTVNVGSGNVDYNVYWNPRSVYVLFHAGVYTTSTFQTSTAGGANSKYLKPPFYSNYDLRLSNTCNMTGTPLTAVTNDYFSTTRSGSLPIIGAHEAQVPSFSASATRIVTPASSNITPSTPYDIEVEIMNTGSTTITSLDVSYNLNGTTVSETFTGLNIPACGLDTVKFTGSKQATFGYGYNEMRAFTGNVNSNTDGQHYDDTTGYYGFCAKLSGNYTINPAGSGTTNFKSFTKAVTALYTCGVDGPVTITASAGTYIEQGTFPGLIPGASATNTVTINGVDATKCRIVWNSTVSDPRHVVQFVGVKHLRFMNIGIENTGTTYGWGISMKANGNQGCDSMLIKGCIIDVNQTIVSSNIVGIAISASNTSYSSSGYNANYTVLDSNTVNGGYFGITWFGYSTTPTYLSHKNKLTRNILNNQYYYGLYLYYHDTMEVSGNRINNLGRGVNTNTYGIYSYYLNYCKITKNRICGQSGGYGIYQNYSTGSATLRCEVSNNMINIGLPSSSSTTYGLYPNYCIYTDWVYNSVLVNGTYMYSTPFSGYFYSGTTYTNNRIYNNNFINNGSGVAMYISGTNTEAQAAVIGGMNNNNYLTKGSNKYYFNGTLFSSDSLWSSATYMGIANDTNSVSIDPEYFSPCDMHTHSLALDSTGVALAGYTEDIDGETRSTTKTDIGCDEYTPPSNNIGPLVILKPIAPAAAGLTDVWVNFKNFGFNTITSAKINYKIGKKGTVKTITWSGSLTSLAQDTARFTGSNQYLLTIAAKDTLYVFTSEPNGVTDGYTLNDTIWKTTCGALSGTFTIGSTPSSTNYATWQEAVITASACGISAPVVFNVAAGTYTEQVLINKIPGATGNNTVTFRSADGNPSSVTLQYAAPLVLTQNYTLMLKGAKRIIIKDLTLKSTATSTITNYGSVVNFEMDGLVSSDSNILYNNIITGMNVNSTSQYYSPVFCYNQNHNYNSFVKNTINYGSNGIFWAGLSPTVPNLIMSRNVIIDSNIISDFYYHGIAMQYMEYPIVSNNKITSASAYGSKRGIFSSYIAKGGVMKNNNIKLSSDVGFGVIVQYPSYYIYSYGSYMADSGYRKFYILNNSVSCLGTTSTGKYGLYVYYPTNTYLYHNSVNMVGMGTALYTYAYSDTSYRIVNNNFATQVGITAIFNGLITGYSMVDHNNYYNATSGGVIASIIGSGFGNASSMAGVFYNSPVKSDINSKSVNPMYYSTTDLHIKNTALSTAGKFVGVSRDIENTVRNSSTPTIGAYEFTGDIRVSTLLSPLTICKTNDLTSVQLRVKNVGFTSASNFYVNYSLNGGSVYSHLVSNTLAAGDSIDIIHNIQTPFTLTGINTIKAFTSWVFDNNTNDTFNGSIDVYHLPKVSFTYSDTCAGNSLKLTSTSTVTGSTISANTWKYGDGTTGTGSPVSHTYSTPGTAYYVKLISTSAYNCVDSFTRQILILPELNPGSIGANQTICYNTSPALIYNITSASGSQAPYTFQWQSSNDNVTYTDISGATGLDYQPPSLIITKYYRRMVKTVSGCGPRYSNIIKITTNTILNAGVIGSPQTICYNGTGTAFSFSTAPSGAYGTYNYQWQQSPDSSTWSNITGANSNTYTPTNVTSITYYRVLVTSGNCPSEGTNGVKVKLYSPITGGSIGSGQVICAGYTPAGFTQISAPTGGPGSYTFQWQSSTDSINWTDISGATLSTYSSPALLQLTYFKRLAQSPGCPSGESNAIKVRTLPKPNIVFTAANHCYNDPMPITNNSWISSGTLTYLWKFGDGTTSTSNVPNKTYASSGTYTVTLVGTSNLGCKDSVSKSVLVATSPTPAYSFVLKCDGDSAIFTDETIYACGAGSGLQFYWNFGDGSTSNVQHARHHYASSGTYNVKFRISLPGGFKDSLTKVVVFNIRSIPAFTATNECYPNANTFTHSSSNYASLLWKFGDGTTSTSTSSSFTKTYSTAASYTAKLISTSSFGCKDSVVKTVELYSKPSANFSTSNNCIGLSTSFSNSSSGAITYYWKFGDGGTSTSVNPTHTYATAGTYNITLLVKSINNCIDSIIKTVTIYPNPTAGFTTNNVCYGFISSFTNTSSGASTYNWDFGNGTTSTLANPSYTYPNPGNYTVTLSAKTSFGCTNTISSSYTVYSSPEASFSGYNVCIGNSIAFNNTSIGATSNLWSFGDATTSTVKNPVKTYTSAGTYYVKLVVSNVYGCKDSTTGSVVIHPKPTVAFNASNQCLGTFISFDNQTSGASTYLWKFGDGNSSATKSPDYKYANSGTYNVELVAMTIYGCKDSLSKSITVYPKPNVSFTASPNPICRGGIMNFTNTSTGGASYKWAFGNGNISTQTSPTNIYTIDGNYNVKLVVISSNNCTDSTYKTITVWARPKASFNVNNGCTNDNLAFASNSVGAVGHAWTFGDGNTSSTANPVKAYNSPGTYNVKLIVTSINGCFDTTNSNVTIHPRASVSFTHSSNYCVGTSATFTNNSTLSAGSMTYQWKFGDGNTSSSTNPTHTYSSGGNYIVNLTATTDKGCVNSYTSNVVVFGKPTANFNVANVCQGVTATFSNTSSGGTTYAWEFGDGGTSTLASPTHAYTNAGTYNVKLTVTNSNNCTDVIIKQIVIFANPTANFTFVERCKGLATSFTNTSTGANDVYWQFGDGGSSNSLNPNYTYSNSGTYNVTLSVETINGCASNITKTVNVFAMPIASFSIDDDRQCITGNLFNYTDNSSINSGSYTRMWYFGDGGNSTTANPNKSYSTAANYNVKLVVTSNNGCKDSTNAPVMVYPKPTANFNINSASQCFKGHLFNFTDASTISEGSLNRLWNFGDATMSAGVNAVKTYSATGSYNVTLTVNSDFGCSDNITKTVTINESPTASFTYNDEIQCLNGNTFLFTNNTSGVVTYNSKWTLGDGTTVTTKDASRTYATAGNYIVKLVVSTIFGCKDSAYYTMRVLANPANTTIAGPTNIPNESIQTYTVPYNAGSSYNWVAVNGTVLSNGASTIQVKWNSKPSVSGSLTVTETGSNGCIGNPANYNVTLYDATSVSSIRKNSFVANIYPNPAKEVFTVEVSTGDKVNMVVYDQLGKAVLNNIEFNNTVTISNHNLASGVYYIKLSTKQGNSMLRFEVSN
ncbi:MAG: PKD domain-containing protein [Bacteroidia bacterium]|nr:PKD domain-containing protein [Bacteroidia bacterium]